MGCTESALRRAPELPNYALGEVLGEGAYGVVHAAWDLQRKSECAVKVFDLHGAKLEKVEHEAHILRTVKHSCIANLREVYCTGSDFAYLVLDIYKGGSLINNLTRLWSTGGSVSTPAVQNLAKMMTQAVEWLHRQFIIHRDLKTDNFVLNRTDFEHPECRVFLCDFDTACALAPDQRLQEQVGTPHYWAPELYSKNYGLPADTWALGVITFGLLWGRFPFRSQRQTASMQLRCPAGASQDGECFVEGMLTKDESVRLTMKQALEHNFLSIRSAAELEEGAKGRTLSGVSTSAPDSCPDLTYSGSTMA